MLPPPPHEIENINKTNGASQKNRRVKRREDRIPGGITIPSNGIVHNQSPDTETGRRRDPVEGAVVVTVTLKSVAVLESNGMLAGAVHVDSAGAPVQFTVAVPLIPSPPI